MVIDPLISHADIVARAGGPSFVSRKLSDHEEAQGRAGVGVNTVKAWKHNDSIPAPYFQAFVALGLASLEELAAGAALRRA